MPTYTYFCHEEKKTVDIYQKISDEPLTVCPECQGSLKKIPAPCSFILAGDNWEKKSGY